MSTDQNLLQPQSVVEGTFRQQTPVDNAEIGGNPETPQNEQGTIQQASGTEWVDIPPELMPRFNRIYHNLKEKERENAEVRAHLAQLTQAFNQYQADQAAGQEAVQRQQILGRMAQAKEQGNIAEEVRLQGELATLGQRVQKPVPLQAPPPPPDPTVTYVSEWSREVAQDGNYKRPWAIEGHPRYAEAFNFIANLSQDPRYQGQTDAILAAADRHMGVFQAQPRPPGAAVLSGGQVRPSVDSAVQLSPDQLAIAKKFGISPKNYAAQQALINQYGGAYVAGTKPRNGAKP